MWPPAAPARLNHSGRPDRIPIEKYSNEERLMGRSSFFIWFFSIPRVSPGAIDPPPFQGEYPPGRAKRLPFRNAEPWAPRAPARGYRNRRIPPLGPLSSSSRGVDRISAFETNVEQDIPDLELGGPRVTIRHILVKVESESISSKDAAETREIAPTEFPEENLIQACECHIPGTRHVTISVTLTLFPLDLRFLPQGYVIGNNNIFPPAFRLVACVRRGLAVVVVL